MNQDEILDDINEDREAAGMAPLKPSPALLKFDELSDLIGDYQNERNQLQDDLYHMARGMREQGFDGDFDPNAASKKRFDQVSRLIESARKRRAALETKLTETDREIQEELESFWRDECADAAYAASERAFGC